MNQETTQYKQPIYFTNLKNKRTRGILTPWARDAMTRTFEAGKNCNQIAKMFNVPVGTVHSVVKGRNEIPKFTKEKKPEFKQKNTTIAEALKLLQERKSALLLELSKLDNAIDELNKL